LTDVSIITPCFNEIGNVALLLDQLTRSLDGAQLDWEVIFVDDDSPDGTAAEIRAQAEHNHRVRCIQRKTERGLASAVIWGLQAAHGNICVVMDADLQHDASIIPDMVQAIRGGYDIAIGVRFDSQNSTAELEGLSSGWRNRLSRYGNRVLNWVLGQQLHDPLSGFFAISRDMANTSLARLSGEGFKILFDLLYHHRNSKVAQIHFQFGQRTYGESKLEPLVIWHLYCDLTSKILRYTVPARFIGFITVGVFGAAIHFSTLYLLLFIGFDFWACQFGATVTAMVNNFLINNMLTYSDRRLLGKNLFVGMAYYGAASAIGILANVGVASYVFTFQGRSTIVSSLSGVLVDLIWRYSFANRIIWNRRSGRS
jgi:dolichol-phosphate mannosyltransferase